MVVKAPQVSIIRSQRSLGVGIFTEVEILWDGKGKRGLGLC